MQDNIPDMRTTNDAKKDEKEIEKQKDKSLDMLDSNVGTLVDSDYSINIYSR